MAPSGFLNQNIGIYINGNLVSLGVSQGHKTSKAAQNDTGWQQLEPEVLNRFGRLLGLRTSRHIAAQLLEVDKKN